MSDGSTGLPGLLRWTADREVFSRRDLKLQEKIVFCRIKTSHELNPGQCTPSYGTLAAELGVSKITVRRAIERLQEIGALKATSQRGVRNLYIPQPCSTWSIVDRAPRGARWNESNRAQRGAQSQAVDRAPRGAGGVLHAEQGVCSTRSIKGSSRVAEGIFCASSDARESAFALQPEPVCTPPKRSPKPDPQAQWFAEFWSGIWRKRGKAQAEKTFRRQVKTEADFRLVMAARNRDLPEYLSREEQFRPHPATWLNSEDWRESAGDAQPARPSPGDLLRAAMATDTRPDWEGGGA